MTDLTYVPTWSGLAYVYFITDAFSRMIVGWRVASHMRTDMVLDALEMARWSRGHHARRADLHTPTPESQFTSIRYGERLDEIGAVPSIGSCRRLLRQRAGRDDQRPLQDRADPRARAGPVGDVDDVELATLSWVHWFNTERLHGYLGDVPPAEFEAAYAAQQTDQQLVGIQ